MLSAQVLQHTLGHGMSDYINMTLQWYSITSHTIILTQHVLQWNYTYKLKHTLIKTLVELNWKKDWWTWLNKSSIERNTLKPFCHNCKIHKFWQEEFGHQSYKLWVDVILRVWQRVWTIFYHQKSISSKLHPIFF